MNDDYLFLCPKPVQTGMSDDRHVCDSRDDLDKPFLDDNDEVCYPMQILILRCIGCGNALTTYENSGGRWGLYVIVEEPV